MHHPWRTLPEHVIVEYKSLPPPKRGQTRGTATIELHDRLRQVERRCTLEHEKIHLERGDMGKCPPPVERAINREVARRLVPFSALMDAMAWSDDLEEVAWELWVTPQIAQARIDSLKPAELLRIAALIADLRG